MLSKFSKLTLLSLLLLFSVSVSAQFTPTISLRVQQGDLKALKGQKNINVVYVYDNMGVGNMSEEAYVKEKVEKYNKEKAGKGDEWKAKWLSAREERYKPKFEELMNKQIAKQGTMVGSYPDAEYTMVVHTTFTEPGFNVGVMRKPAFTNYEIKFVNNNTQANAATVVIMNSPGNGAMGYDFDAGLRIQESYAKAGKHLGQHLVKSKVL